MGAAGFWQRHKTKPGNGMSIRVKMAGAVIIALAVLLIGVGLGSVFVPPAQVLSIIGHKLFGTALAGGIEGAQIAIIWSLRLPRALLTFIVGGALSVSG